MGRWSHLDSDEERLPDGMTRVGYDADTQIYTYRDSDGSYWEGAPGVQYGKLFRVKSHREEAPPLPSITIPDDIQGEEPPHPTLPDYEGDGIPRAQTWSQSQTPSLFSRTTTSSPPLSLSSQRTLATPGRVRLRRSHYQQKKSKRLPSLPDNGSEKHSILSRVTTEEETESCIPEAPELTPSHSHSNHSVEDDDSIRKDDLYAGANPTFTQPVVPTPNIHRQRRAQEREKKQEQSGMKRAGTISRIARFLSRRAGGEKKDKDGDSTITGLRSGRSTAFGSTATGFSTKSKWTRWPGFGSRMSEDSSRPNEEVRVEKEEVEGIPRSVMNFQSQPPHRRTASGFAPAQGMPVPQTRKRAMTFDEILASDGRLRGVITA